MDKMRDEFSKHCQIWQYSEEVDENDFFVNATTQRAWDVWVTAWQASRAALVVQLPAPCYRAEYVYHCSNDLEWDNYFEIEEVKYVLSEAGIKCS